MAAGWLGPGHCMFSGDPDVHLVQGSRMFSTPPAAHPFSTTLLGHHEDELGTREKIQSHALLQPTPPPPPMLIPIRFWASFCRVTFPGTVGIPLEREAHEAESPGGWIIGWDREEGGGSKLPRGSKHHTAFSYLAKETAFYAETCTALRIMQVWDHIPALPLISYGTWICHLFCISVSSSLKWHG